MTMPSIRMRAFMDAEGSVWVAPNKTALKTSWEAYRVSWPVREMLEYELDTFKVDYTPPDADVFAEDFESTIMTLREIMFEEVYGSDEVRCISTNEGQ